MDILFSLQQLFVINVQLEITRMQMFLNQIPLRSSLLS